jgi:hypothetical protein
VTVPLERQIACLRREVGLRKRVYPRWIQNGRMTQEQADSQIEAMEAAQATLERVRDEEKARVTPGLF